MGKARASDAAVHAGREIAHPGYGPLHEAAVAQKHDAARVLAPVLEPAQPFDQNRNDIAPRGGGHNAAHYLASCFAGTAAPAGLAAPPAAAE
jgi:hypothetical protein